MITRNALIVIFILTLVFIVAAWSKLHILDDDDFQPQRWRLDEHPAFRSDAKPPR
jgi:hypothetical protein